MTWHQRLRRSGIPFMLLLVLSFPAGAENLCLWHLKDGPTDVYLLGSIHALQPGSYPMHPAIENAYRQSDTIVFEVDLMQSTAAEMAATMQSEGMFPPGESIEQTLSTPTLTMLRQYLADRNIGMEQVYRMRPWFLSLSISQQELFRAGFDSALGVDQHFLKRAYGDNKQVVAIETFEQQVATLSGDSTRVQDLSLRATLEDMPRYEEDLNALLAAWKAGDADSMLALALSPTTRYPELGAQAESLIFARNDAMQARVREMIKAGGNYLVIVGALHMGGERGLINALQADYKVRQIKR